jgi:hypothetical protein
MHIEAPKVCQLRNDIYFGLEDSFRLCDHAGGIGGGAVFLGEEVGGLEKDFGSLFKRASVSTPDGLLAPLL